MMTTYERLDIIHIMKMNRLTLSDLDSEHLELSGQVRGKDYRIIILVLEDLPRISVKQSGATVFEDTMKSVDDFVDVSGRTPVPLSGNVISIEGVN